MKLTEKCREDYIKYISEKYKLFTGEDFFIMTSIVAVENTLIIEFFDSVEIYIGVLICIDETFDSYTLQNDVRTECSQFQENRINAINAAIEKANEIYNNDK
ncbi:MAG TPA: hypothetical protein VLA48_03425 [Nitrososphaeraceae archaeon]|nr:hypothetical protein [Nitrososphaeraceae archaeon]